MAETALVTFVLYICAFIVAIVWVIFPFVVINKLNRLIDIGQKIGLLLRDDIVKK